MIDKDELDGCMRLCYDDMFVMEMAKLVDCCIGEESS